MNRSIEWSFDARLSKVTVWFYLARSTWCNWRIESNRIESSVGRHISSFCESDLAFNDDKNQCAHYVAHLMGYRMGQGCGHPGGALEEGSIRVNEIFNEMRETGYWFRRPVSLDFCLAILTVRKAVGSRNGELYMTAVRQKHIGFFLGGRIYNYSNPKDKVHVETPEEFFEGRRADSYEKTAKSKPVHLYATLG